MTEPRTVALIFGGRSSEHSISCITAKAIMEHLGNYRVVPVGITEEGAWVVATPPEGELPKVTGGEEVTLSLNPATRGRISYLDGREYATVDVIFPVLHGPYGEDGTIQGLFELSSIPYVGSGVLASAMGMDKAFSREVVARAGVPVDQRTITLYENRELSDAEKETLGLPVFVKPVRGGSSIGITRVTRWEDYAEAAELAFGYDTKIIIEAEVVGQEVELGVLEKDGEVIVSEPALLLGIDETEEGFYGFKTKYLENTVRAQIPAPLSPEDTANLKKYARACFHALECKGLARVDFFLTEEGPTFNEINTMPGFTPISMYPQVFEHSGIDYPSLLDAMIQQALRDGSHR